MNGDDNCYLPDKNSVEDGDVENSDFNVLIDSSVFLMADEYFCIVKINWNKKNLSRQAILALTINYTIFT